MRVIQGVGEVAAHYDLFLVDLWGVMHDGIRCHKAALDCLARLKQEGKKVALLSNAPRRVQDVGQRSAEMGLTPAFYDAIFTSGEMTFSYLQKAPLGRLAFPIMTEKDHSLIENAPIEICADIEKADFILCSGPSEEKGKIADWDAILRRARIRDLVLLCANPDLIVHRGGKEEICAGALAQHYEVLGGKVLYQGKPHAEIYHWALKKMAVSPQRTLAFGDSLRTDIAGAHNGGCDSLFVASGIHKTVLLPDLSLEKLRRLAENYPTSPTFAVEYLNW